MRFNELAESIQEKLHNQYLEYQASDNDWSESTIDYLEDELENELNVDDIKITFTGDQVTIIGSIHVQTFIEDVLGDSGSYPLLMYIIANNDLNDDYVSIHETNQRYARWRTVKVGDIEFTSDASDLEDIAEEELSELRSAMQDWVDDKCTEVLSKLQREYDELCSFKYFSDTQIENEIDFDEDGNEV